MTTAWLHANQRNIAGLGEIVDFLAAHAVTVPAGHAPPRVLIDADMPDDVAVFASRYCIGASVDCDGRTYVDMHFGAAVLRIQAEGGAS